MLACFHQVRDWGYLPQNGFGILEYQPWVICTLLEKNTTDTDRAVARLIPLFMASRVDASSLMSPYCTHPEKKRSLNSCTELKHKH